jgi:hypothetical protein
LAFLPPETKTDRLLKLHLAQHRWTRKMVEDEADTHHTRSQECPDGLQVITQNLLHSAKQAKTRLQNIATRHSTVSHKTKQQALKM